MGSRYIQVCSVKERISSFAKKRQNCPRSNSCCEDGFAWGYENKGMARAKFHKLLELSMENDGSIVEYKDKWENLYSDI